MTYTGQKIDLNIYLKVLSGLYFDFEVKGDKKKFLNYLFTLFGADHPSEVFTFGGELLEEYIDTNM